MGAKGLLEFYQNLNDKEGHYAEGAIFVFHTCTSLVLIIYNFIIREIALSYRIQNCTSRRSLQRLKQQGSKPEEDPQQNPR